MKQAMGILGVGLLALLLDRTQTQSDEPTPSRVADVATLTARVSELEKRVQALETPAVAESATIAESASALPAARQPCCANPRNANRPVLIPYSMSLCCGCRSNPAPCNPP